MQKIIMVHGDFKGANYFLKNEGRDQGKCSMAAIQSWASFGEFLRLEHVNWTSWSCQHLPAIMSQWLFRAVFESLGSLTGNPCMVPGEGCCAFDFQWTGPGIGATDLIYLFCGSVEEQRCRVAGSLGVHRQGDVHASHTQTLHILYTVISPTTFVRWRRYTFCILLCDYMWLYVSDVRTHVLHVLYCIFMFMNVAWLSSLFNTRHGHTHRCIMIFAYHCASVVYMI